MSAFMNSPCTQIEKWKTPPSSNSDLPNIKASHSPSPRTRQKMNSKRQRRRYGNFYANNDNELVLGRSEANERPRNWTALAKQANIMKFNIRLKARVDNRSIAVRAYESKYPGPTVITFDVPYITETGIDRSTVSLWRGCNSTSISLPENDERDEVASH